MSAGLTYFCLVLTAMLPAIAAFVRAKYFFHFPRRSMQLLMTAPTLLAMFGVLPLQWLLQDSLRPPVSRDLWSAMTAIQYAAAAIVFVWKLTSEQRRIPPEQLARLTDLNKRW